MQGHKVTIEFDGASVTYCQSNDDYSNPQESLEMSLAEAMRASRLSRCERFVAGVLVKMIELDDDCSIDIFMDEHQAFFDAAQKLVEAYEKMDSGEA